MVYTVKIEPRPDQEKRDSADQEYREKQLNLTWWLNIISGIGAGVAFFALVAFIYYACLVRRSNTIAQTANDLAYRPYIGVDQIVVRFYQGAGDITGTADPTEQTTFMGVTIHIKNFGPVPATNYASELHAFIGDAELPYQEVAHKPGTFFPGQVLNQAVRLTPLGYKVVSLREKPLTVNVKVSYDGPTGHTEGCDKALYLPEASRFAKVGPCP